MFILTGSRALDFWLHRKNSKSDWDFICSENDLNRINLSFDGKDAIKVDNVEFISSSLLNNDKFIGEPISSYLEKDNDFWFNYAVCSIKELYIQKRSHIWRPLKFKRHIEELQILKKECLDLYEEVPSINNGILKERIKMTKEKYGHRAPSLMQSNKDFFDDYVTKYYIHDDIHEIMAHYDKPLYLRLKHEEDLDSAYCRKDLWERLSHEDKVKCVQEECYVIAVERFMIPAMEQNKRVPPELSSFMIALEKVCTTLTSGYFRDFAIDNWAEIKMFVPGYYTKVTNAINSGKLKRIDDASRV